MKKLKATYEAATGKTLIEKSLGSVEDLKAEIEKRQQEGQPPEEYMYLQYFWTMFSGKGKLAPLDNSRYPDVQPTRVAAFFQQSS